MSKLADPLLEPFCFVASLVYSVMMNERCPEIKINYSLEIDQDVVQAALGYSAWYIEHGYEPLLPTKISIKEAKSLSQKEIFELIGKEYNNDFYKDTSNALKNHWELFKSNWPSEEIQKMGILFDDEYVVNLTRYGVGATYNESEGALILNVSDKEVEKLASIVFHELIHLAIEGDIKKYDIGHWQKERLVDLIFKRLFPGQSFEQKLPPEAHDIDQFFEKSSGEVKKTMIDFSLAQR